MERKLAVFCEDSIDSVARKAEITLRKKFASRRFLS
jgi:hypothetical protein